MAIKHGRTMKRTNDPLVHIVDPRARVLIRTMQATLQELLRYDRDHCDPQLAEAYKLTTHALRIVRKVVA